MMIAGIASAQTSLAEMNTAMNMQNTLNGGPVGPPSSQYFAPPAGMQPGMQPGMMPQTGMFNMMTAPGQFGQMGMPGGAPLAPATKQILVLTGQQVKCHVTNALLEDIHYEYRPESEKDKLFYDDGTHGDLLANDNIWTNFTLNTDVLSPEANRLKLIYLRMLQICEDTNPLDFFRIPIASDEPLTPLPRVSDQENDRDKTFLEEWHKRFLGLYRLDPENPKSDFYPIFVPSAPRKPEIPSPPDDQFNAGAYQLDAYIQNIIDQATGVNQQPNTGYYQEPAPTTGRRTAGSRQSSGPAYGDRWGQLRSDARALSRTYGTNQSSSYFGR